MSAIALGLVLASAVLHTVWNLVLKQAANKQMLTWWALVAGFVLSSPVLLLGPPIPARVWPYVLGSAVAEAAYFWMLVRAYERADFSLVYPLARGAAPALLALWAALLLDERLSAAGVGGLALVLAGLTLVGGARLFGPGRVALRELRGVGSALGVALCISVYSLIGAAAVRFAPPAPFAVLDLGLTALLLAPLVLGRHGGRAVLAAAAAAPLRIAAVGALMMLTYMLVLTAYALGPVSYAGALRESSVVLAALAGWLWLGESFGAVRVAGAVLIFAGIVLVAAIG
jgi:drug/metabolite transporter (DMT)-like permease